MTMIAKAKVRFLRVSPTKVRPLINLIRGKNVLDSQAILLHANRGSSKAVQKLLNSALSNAKQKGLAEDQLYISRITADLGPTMKRWRAVAFGRATGILKKTTHLTIELDLITK
jgi:large subunit ribosomal protein L22